MNKALLLKALDTFEKQTRADWRRYHRIADKAAPKVFRAFNQAVARLSLSVSVNKATAFLEQGDMSNALEVPNWAQFEQDIIDLPLTKPFMEGAEMAVDEIIRNKELREVALENINKASAAVEIELAFNLRDVEAERFLVQNQQFLVNSIAIESKDAVRNVILRGFEEGKPPRVMAREIKNLVGLNNKQATAIINLRTRLNEQMAAGKSPFKTIPLTPDKIDDIVAKATKKAIRQRAENLARTETIRASNSGRYNTWSQAISEGLLPSTVSVRWITAGDERVCFFCGPLDNTVVGFRESFSASVERQNGSISTLAEIHPPLHPLCYDKETEVYTDSGWKLFKDLTGKEQILSIDPDTQEIEWLPYIKYIEYPYVGKMYHFTSKSMDLLVTPDHSMYAATRVDRGKKGRHKEWRLMPAKELVNKQEYYILRTAKWTGKDIESVNINGIEIESKLFARFMGYYLSEGSVTKRSEGCYQISIHQIEPGLTRIYEGIKDLPFNVNRGKDKIYINDVRLGKYLMQFGKSHQKYVPDEVREMSSELIEEYLDAYCYGDGSIRISHWEEKDFYSLSRCFTTSSKKMADGLSELLLKIGKNASLGIAKTAGKLQKFANGEYVINHDTYRIAENNSNTAVHMRSNNYGLKTKEIAYSGMVYDVELPKNHVLWVRRNGKACFSGNCRCDLVLEIDDSGSESGSNVFTNAAAAAKIAATNREAQEELV